MTGSKESDLCIKNTSSRACRRLARSENSFEGSSSGSDSDLSGSSGSAIFESEALQRYRRRHNRRRRESAASVSTSPDEEAYVMVLQNKMGSGEDVKNMASLKNVYDVTFLVGEEKKPVHGVRAIISEKSSFLQQLIESFEKNEKAIKPSNTSKFRRSFAKLRKLTRSSGRSKFPSGQRLVIPMVTYDAEAFQRLMAYIHCGTLTVDASTVIGLMNAAYMFEFPEVLRACWDFAMGCAVRTDNLLDLLLSAQKYKHHKMTIELMKEMKQRKAEYPDILLYEETLNTLAGETCATHESLAGAT